MKTRKLWSGILILGLLAFAHSVSSAAVPRTINYQGYLTDSSGQPVNGSVNLSFGLFDTATGGSELWVETHPGVMVTNGDYSVVLGSVDPVGNPLTLPFDVPYWLGMSVNAGPEKMPRMALASVPYALGSDYAANADTLEGAPASAFAWAGHTHSAWEITTPLALAGHNHYAENWTGDDSNYGLRVENAGAGKAIEAVGGKYGVYATVSNAAASFHAGHFETTGTYNTHAVGVYGKSWPAANYGYGGYFEGGFTGVSGASSHIGVSGTGTDYGMIGSSSGAGTGVYGSSLSGYGLLGISSSGYGVYGFSNNADGVIGHTSNASAYGLHSLGNAKVEGNLVVTGTIKSTVSRSLVFGPADVQYQPGVTGVIYGDGSLSYLTSGTGSGLNGLISLSVVPHGATVTDIECTVTDNSSSNEMGFGAYECNVFGSCTSKISWCYSGKVGGCTSNPAYANSGSNTLNPAVSSFVVDRTNNSYIITIYTSNTSCGASCHFHSCKVTYHE